MIILFTTLHTKCAPIRAEEYKTCLLKNLDNPNIDEVRVVLETDEENDYGFLQGLVHEKLKIHGVGQRPYYSELFSLANQQGDGNIVIICNGDIYFDHCTNWKDIESVSENDFWSVSRYNESPEGEWVLFDQADKGSHDCWVLRTPIRTFSSDYHLGIIGCDQLIAQRAVEAGFRVANPCLSITCRHLHRSNIRNHFLSQNSLTYRDQKDFMNLGMKLYCAPPSTIRSLITCSNRSPQYLFMSWIGRWFLPFYRLPSIQKLIMLKNNAH
jgi:hypothetical protein